MRPETITEHLRNALTVLRYWSGPLDEAAARAVERRITAALDLADQLRRASADRAPGTFQQLARELL